MAPPPRRFRTTRRNNLGVNFAPKKKRVSPKRSMMKKSRFDTSIKSVYPFVLYDSSKPKFEVHIWDDFFHIPVEYYKLFLETRHPNTFYRREYQVRAKGKDNDNYLFVPWNNKRYRSSAEFEKALTHP